MVTIDQLKSLKHLTDQAKPLFAQHQFREMDNVWVDGEPGRKFIHRQIVEWFMEMPVIGYMVLDASGPEKPAQFYYEPRLTEAE